MLGAVACAVLTGTPIISGVLEKSPVISFQLASIWHSLRLILSGLIISSLSDYKQSIGISQIRGSCPADGYTEADIEGSPIRIH